jgi:2-dehydropantoate 2-reductase
LNPDSGFTSVAVLGVGGVGGCIAAVLSNRGVPVTCIVREDSARAIREQGLVLESALFGNFSTHPEVAGRLSTPPDLLFIATKANHLDSALDRIDPACLDGTVIIPLLNGLEHMPLLRARLGRRVIAGSISIVAALTAPGRIRHTSPFIRMAIASDGDIAREHLETIAESLSGFGLETTVLDSEACVLWGKLVRLAAIACTTSLADQPLGILRAESTWRAVLGAFLAEGARVAKAEGVVIDPVAQLAIIDSLPATLTSSMHRDIVAGRFSELDAIAGAIVRAGERHGLGCPTIRELIRNIEAKIELMNHSRQETGPCQRQ